MAEGPESEQLRAMHRMVELAEQRTEMAAERNYMAAERTLSVWIRTALGLMTLGLALDRFGLFLQSSVHPGLHSAVPSTWGGAALITFGIVVAVLTAVRFQRYAAAYRRNHAEPAHHGPFLAPAFAAMAALFGVALLVLLFAVTWAAAPARQRCRRVGWPGQLQTRPTRGSRSKSGADPQP